SDGSMKESIAVTSGRLLDSVVLGMTRRDAKGRLVGGRVQNANDQHAERRHRRGAQRSQEFGGGERRADEHAGQSARESGTNGRCGDSQGGHDSLLTLLERLAVRRDWVQWRCHRGPDDGGREFSRSDSDFAERPRNRRIQHATWGRGATAAKLIQRQLYLALRPG